jgi:transposase
MTTGAMQHSGKEVALYVALETGSSKWVVQVCTWEAITTRCFTVAAGELKAFLEHLRRAKKSLGLAADAAVFSCYEAGRDGFWIHRALCEANITNLVVDPASIEVNRRARRVKTDKIDATQLVFRLRRHYRGEAPFKVVQVPSEQDEDARRPVRERVRLLNERVSLTNAIRGVLKAQGIVVENVDRVRADELRTWAGKPLGAELRCELERMLKRRKLVQEQLDEIETARKERLREAGKAPDNGVGKVHQLMQLRGVGASAWTLILELFGWREFKNRRQVGAFVGMTPTPYSSDNTRFEQGISKSGSPRIRSLAVELAWLWVRYQPESTLTLWFHERFARGGGRARKIGIVAVARRLLVQLWHYVEHGVVPPGARLKGRTASTSGSEDEVSSGAVLAGTSSAPAA